MATPLFDFTAKQVYSVKELNTDQAKKIQALLKGAGYPVTVDGVIGKQTIEQFARFKVDNYLEHPFDLGVTTYNELIEESELRQVAIQPSDEDKPINPPLRPTQKKVKVNGFGEVLLSTRISKYFTWGEATHQGTRPVTNAEHAENIRQLAIALDEFREYVDKPFKVTSWYRPEPWNSRAGGARRSQHLYGKGIDIICSGLTGRQLGEKAKKFGWKGGIGVYKNKPTILHLDIASPRSWGF